MKLFEKQIKEGSAFDDLTHLILVMLGQYGGALSQKAITKNIGLPFEVISKTLHEMEIDGLVTREWINNDYSYRVVKVFDPGGHNHH
ncbi:MAG: MarR family transcriptional regulator [Chitinivibrionales bacterium]|nr:MarR family transcriptional regulator [Chitinivibrionales bacterium]